MSLATPSDGRRRSGSGETQARPGATVKMIDKHALVHYLNEKRLMLSSGGQERPRRASLRARGRESAQA